MSLKNYHHQDARVTKNHSVIPLNSLYPYSCWIPFSGKDASHNYMSFIGPLTPSLSIEQSLFPAIKSNVIAELIDRQLGKKNQSQFILEGPFPSGLSCLSKKVTNFRYPRLRSDTSSKINPRHYLCRYSICPLNEPEVLRLVDHSCYTFLHTIIQEGCSVYKCGAETRDQISPIVTIYRKQN